MNSYIKLLLFSFILYSCATKVPQKKEKALPSPSGISYLNKLRNNLGMISLKTNKKLSYSSKNHARYLSKFGFKDPHVEKYKSSKLFTGHKVKDRVITAGYKTTYSSENITQSPTFDTKYLKPTKPQEWDTKQNTWLNTLDINEEQLEKVQDLIRASIVEIVRSDEVQGLIDEGILDEYNDVYNIQELAKTILAH